MPATCKCPNGHTWTARVIDDDPSTNSSEVETSECPECGSDDFEIIEMFDDDEPDLNYEDWDD